MLLYAHLASVLLGALTLGSDQACACGRGPVVTTQATSGPTLVVLDKKDDAKKAEEEAEIKKNLAKLSDDDRKAAEAQKYCAIEDDNRLGSMGVPVKIVLKDSKGKEQPVFLCCKGCKDDATKDPAATLAKVEKLKAKAKDEDKKTDEEKK
jgi:hypothetical protein